MTGSDTSALEVVQVLYGAALAHHEHRPHDVTLLVAVLDGIATGRVVHVATVAAARLATVARLDADVVAAACQHPTIRATVLARVAGLPPARVDARRLPDITTEVIPTLATLLECAAYQLAIPVDRFATRLCLSAAQAVSG